MKMLTQRLQAARDAEHGENARSSGVLGLHFSGTPFDVSWLVSSRVIKAFKRHVWGRFSNVIDEVLKRHPAFADSYPTASVIVKRRMVGAEASAFHVEPSDINSWRKSATCVTMNFRHSIGSFFAVFSGWHWRLPVLAAILLSQSVLGQPILRNAATTNNPARTPPALPANTGPLYPMSVLLPDGSGADRIVSYSPAFFILSTNAHLSGIVKAGGGQFTNTLTLNGSPVSTNSGGSVGPGTVNTIPKWTGTNTLGDSGITETNDSSNYHFEFGVTNSGVNVIVAPKVGDSSGNSLTVIGGVGLDGDGGTLTLQGAPGVGTDKNGGNVVISSGASTGSGTAGQLLMFSSGNAVSILGTPINLLSAVNFASSLTLSGQTGFPYTDDGTQLLRNGVPVGGGGGTVTGSGTVGTVPLWTTSTTNLGNSIVTQSGTNATIAGHLISQGNHTFSADNTYDIGASGATRPRSIYAATSAIINAPTAITASAPVLNLSQTWNNSGVTFTGILAIFTNTASAATSKLIDLQMPSGTTQFNVDRMGNVFANASITGLGSIQMGQNGVFSANARSGLFSPANGIWVMNNNAGTDFTRLDFGSTTAAFPALARTLAGFTIMGADGTANSTNSLIIPGTLSVTNRSGTATSLAGWANNASVDVTVGTGLSLSSGTLSATATGNASTWVPNTELTYSGGTNLTIDGSGGTNFFVLLTNTAFFVTPANPPASKSTNTGFTVFFQQDSTGTRDVSWTNGSFKFPNGTQFKPLTNANSVSWVSFTMSPFTNSIFMADYGVLGIQ